MSLHRAAGERSRLRVGFGAAALLAAIGALGGIERARAGSITWEFDSSAGYLFDSTRVEFESGDAALRRDPAWPDPLRPCGRLVTLPASSSPLAAGLTQVEVLLDSTNFDFTRAAADGHDLVFRDDRGAALGTWIESFDARARKALLTVALPAFDPAAEHTVRLLYGNAAAAAADSWESVYLDGRQLLPTFPITSGAQFDAFPAMECVAGDTLLVAYRTGSSHGSRDGALMLARSGDGGESWAAAPLFDEPTLDDRVDLGLKKLSGGALLLPFYQANGGAPTGCFLMRSADGGRNWSAPAAIANAFTHWMAVYGQIVELPDGTLLLPAYGNQSGVAQTWSALLESTDDGADWSLRSIIASGPISYTETSVVRLGGHDLLAVVRGGAEPTLLFSVFSHDDGRSWSEPRALFPGASPSLLVLPDGDILLGCADRVGITGERLSVSRDRGATWPHSVLVDPDRETDIGYPAFHARADGSILAVFYRRYAGLRRAVFDEAFVTENPNFVDFFDGFEDGAIDDWQIWRLSGYPSMAGRCETARSGRYALFLDDRSANSNPAAIRTLYALEQSAGRISFWIRPDSVANGIEIALLSGDDALSAVARFRFRISQEGTLESLTPGSDLWSPLTSTGALRRGAWTKLAIDFRSDAGEASVFVNGFPVGNAVACEAGGDITHLGFYAGTSEGAGDRFVVDDLYAGRSTETGAPPFVAAERTAYAAGAQAVTCFSQALGAQAEPLSFHETADKGGGNVTYQLTNDGGTTWSWWNGEVWTPSGDSAAKANPAAEIADHIGAFPASARLGARAFLEGDGKDAVRLGRIEIGVGAPLGETDAAPQNFYVGPASPNPLTSTTAFDVSLPRAGAVLARIYDVSGRNVRNLLTPLLAAGRHSISWEGRGANGREVSSGAYFIDVRSGSYRGSTRVTVRR